MILRRVAARAALVAAFAAAQKGHEPAERSSCALQLGSASAPLTTIRVAIGFYGLARHPCAASTMAAAFLDPLRLDAASSGILYDVDVLVAANLAKTSVSPRSGEVDQTLIQRGNYRLYRPCAVSAVDQLVVDRDIAPIVAGTLGKFGDAWAGQGATARSKLAAGVGEGAATINYLRALASQKRLAELIVAREKARSIGGNATAAVSPFRYDVILSTRLDVLFVAPIEARHYRAMAGAPPPRGPRDRRQSDHRRKAGSKFLLLPSWAHAGYNDRFVLGDRESVLQVLSRIDYVVAHANKTQRCVRTYDARTCDPCGVHKPALGAVGAHARGALCTRSPATPPPLRRQAGPCRAVHGVYCQGAAQDPARAGG